MGSKKAKQIERSKEIITIALLELLKAKSLDSITITQLCNRAGVGRPTFYRHFTSKADVITQFNQKWFSEYFEAVRTAYRQNPSAVTVELVAFDFLKNNEHLMEFVKSKEFYRYGMGELGLQRRQVESAIPIFQDRNHYELEYRVGGMIFVFARWIDTGMKETPEEMAKVFANIYSGMSVNSDMPVSLTQSA